MSKKSRNPFKMAVFPHFCMKINDAKCHKKLALKLHAEAEKNIRNVVEDSRKLLFYKGFKVLKKIKNR